MTIQKTPQVRFWFYRTHGGFKGSVWGETNNDFFAVTVFNPGRSLILRSPRLSKKGSGKKQRATLARFEKGEVVVRSGDCNYLPRIYGLFKARKKKRIVTLHDPTFVDQLQEIWNASLECIISLDKNLYYLYYFPAQTEIARESVHTPHHFEQFQGPKNPKIEDQSLPKNYEKPLENLQQILNHSQFSGPSPCPCLNDVLANPWGGNSPKKTLPEIPPIWRIFPPPSPKWHLSIAPNGPSNDRWFQPR